MSYLRASIATLVVLVFVVLFFMIFSFGAEDLLQLTTNHYLNGEYQKAELSLVRLEKEISPAKMALFRAYIAKGEENRDLEATELAKAKKDKGWEQIYNEVIAFEFLQAFEQRDEIAMENLMEEAPRHPWHSYFKNLLYAWKMDYAKCVPFKDSPPPFSSWDAKFINQLFPPSWIVDFALELKINQGDYLAARRELSRLPSSTTREYLIGLTYLQEGLDKPADLAEPYFDQAFSAFEMSSIYHSKYHLERKRIVQGILRQAARMDAHNKLEKKQLARWLEKLEAFSEAQKLIAK